MIKAVVVTSVVRFLALLCLCYSLVATASHDVVHLTKAPQGNALGTQGNSTVEISALYKASQDDIQTHPKTIEQIASADTAWQKLESQHLPIAEGGNWYKVVIYNPSQAFATSFVTLGNDIVFSSFNVFSEAHGQQIHQESTTLLATNHWLTELTLAPNEYRTLYIQLRSSSELYRPISVESGQQFTAKQGSLQYRNAFAVGAVVAIAIMSLLLGITVRDKALAWLSVYFFLRAGLLSVLVGGHLYYLFPNHDELRGIELLALVGLSTLAFIWFTVYLFQLTKLMPIVVKFAKFASLLLIAISLVSFYLPLSAIVLSTNIVFIAMLVALFTLGLYLHQRKQRLALLFSVIMAVQFLFGLIISLGLFFDISPFSARESLLVVSFLFNVILVVFLICRMYYYQMQDKQLAQKQALANAMTSKQAHEKLIALQEENQEELEQRVQERTLELNIALTELEEANRELEQKNTIDELTGLYNRRFYDQRMLAEYRRSKRNLTPLSLVVIDLDYFKRVNDKYGHLAGDQCLSWLAQHIKQSLKRSTDIGCRYGGEEFCLILPDTDQAGAINLAEELRKAVQSFDFVYHEQHIALTVSCGIATYTQQEHIEPAHIFCAADKALYQAKHNGRNQIKTQEISPDLLIQEHSHD